MLSNENHQFAQAHRDLLDVRLEMLESFLSVPDKDLMIIDRETAEVWAKEIRSHIRAFDRYEMCFKDEQDTKNRYQDRLRDIKLAALGS